MTSFFRENWFWRGTQSAIFYYVSCAPCVESKHKRKRRNEAARTEKQRSEIVTTQPGQIRQPGAFQTNEGWVEEILTGPGPPKGWKTDPIIHKLSSRERDEIRKRGDQLEPPTDGRLQPGDYESALRDVDAIMPVDGTTQIITLDAVPTEPEPASEEHSNIRKPSATSELPSHRTSTSSSSETSPQVATRPRLSVERRLSSAVDNLRITLRSTMNSERWNWKRYEREDEILSGFNQRMTKMWDRATSFTILGQNEGDAKGAVTHGRARAATNESDHFDYQKYARNPEINELHPPVVSRLPATKDDAAWMLLPPPSAAMMEGKARPHEETALRWPLARIGRSAQEWEDLKKLQKLPECLPPPTDDAATDSTPDLSDSLSELVTTDEEDGWRPQAIKRHSAPVVPGWVPYKVTNNEMIHLQTPRAI